MVFTQQCHQVGVDGGVVGLVARDHLDLAAPQARGDLEPLEAADALLGVAQRVGEPGLGQPEHPDHLLAVRRAARCRLLHRGCLQRQRPHRLKFAWRSRQHDDRRLAGYDDARRGAYRIDDMCAGRDERLLAVRRAHRLQVDVGKARHQTLHDVGDLGLEFVVQQQLSATEAGHGRDGHVVGGRAEAAAGDDEIHALGGQEP